MRKLKLQVQMTIDGFIAGPNGELDWMTANWDKELIEYLTAITDPVDTIVLGRKLAEEFIPYWANVATDPKHPEHSAGVKFTETVKVVFSKTIENSPWDNNTTLAKGSLSQEILELRKQQGKDIITYGGAEFVSSLIKEALITDFFLFINPVAIGKGLPIFDQLTGKQNLTLIGSKSFSCGIVVLHYHP